MKNKNSIASEPLATEFQLDLFGRDQSPKFPTCLKIDAALASKKRQCRQALT